MMFSLFAGEGISGPIDLNHFVWLTLIIFIVPVIQTIWLTALMFFHPVIVDDEYDETNKMRKLLRGFNRSLRTCCGVKRMEKKPGGHKWEDTKEKYRSMCVMLKQHFNDKDWIRVQSWLKITEVNVMQYQPNDQDQTREYTIHEETRIDGRAALMRQCTHDDFDIILEDVNGQENSKAETTGNCTDMMKVINYHIRMRNTVDFIKQFNYEMIVSDKTDPYRKGSMEWKGVIDEVTKLEPGLKFPDALRYNRILTRSNNINTKWDHSKLGTELNPHSLLLDPWGTLEKNANGYIKYFLLDTWIFFFQIYFVTVILKILLP